MTMTDNLSIIEFLIKAIMTTEQCSKIDLQTIKYSYCIVELDHVFFIRFKFILAYPFTKVKSNLMLSTELSTRHIDYLAE